MSVIRLLLLVVVFGSAAVACGSKSPGGGGAGGCMMGFNGCACYGNLTCQAGLTCAAASNLCVDLGGIGGMSGGTGGATSGSGTGGATVVGGTGGMSGGTGGATSGSGTGGATVVSGTGGASGCSCSAGQQCTTDGRCVDPKIIDDFADCNPTINLINGRTGAWYAAADVGVNVSFAVSAPPSGFSDHACGAWTTGGPTGNGTTNYALLGVTMTSSDAPISLSAYSGVSVSLEAQAVDFTVKTTNGGYFTKRLTATSGAETETVNFADLVARGDSTVSTFDKTAVTDIQFTVIDPTMGYGFVIHALTLF